MQQDKKRPSFKSATIESKNFAIGPRRAKYYKITEILKGNDFSIPQTSLETLDKLDIAYRALCAILFNYVPKSGHPGGSISSGHIVQGLMFHSMDYNFTDPDATDADHLCYAAGHKAMGLYAGWALRNECVRIGNKSLLPAEKFQLRLEDLLGFRRNPITSSPLFKKHHAKALDGHPTPAVPHVRIATGASGVGVTAAVGLAFGMLDTYRQDPPKMHILEGEGGMTPGRVQEAMAAAGSAEMKNVVMHVDWNQASIDSNHVCRDGEEAGDYVQWNPIELAYLHDWNVIEVDDGFEFKQVLAAQHLANSDLGNDQPTAIVYRTTKGWKYGIEGRSSHGAGHDFCSKEFYASLAEFEKSFQSEFPRFDGAKSEEAVEQAFFDCLLHVRKTLESHAELCQYVAENIGESQKRLKAKKREPHQGAPQLNALYEDKNLTPQTPPPEELGSNPGASATHRGVLGNVLNYLNHKTKGAFIGSSADLFGSTSISNLAKGISKGYYHYSSNPDARLINVGGICEDGIGGFMAGLSAFGHHVGVGSSYGAFIAALQHVPARLHAIGQEARKNAFGDERNPFIIICGHAGPKTGEDGPTHADPQALQLLQENFPKGSCITLTAWDTQEIWPMMIAALQSRAAIIAPFVTRPAETVVDRKARNLPPASEAAKGMYALRKADQKASNYHGTVVLQGNGVATIFVNDVLPELDKQKLNMNVYCVTSAELFDYLPAKEQEAIFPDSLAREAMGISEFTLPTMYRWVASTEGRKRTLHPFKDGHFLGSGQFHKVYAEGHLDGKAQLAAILDYAKHRERL